MREILSIEPYRIKVLWSDNLVRIVDFAGLLQEYTRGKNSYFHQLLEKKIFLKAKTDGRTIYWEGLAEMLDYDGKSVPASLDFDPDILLASSRLL